LNRCDNNGLFRWSPSPLRYRNPVFDPIKRARKRPAARDRTKVVERANGLLLRESRDQLAADEVKVSHLADGNALKGWRLMAYGPCHVFRLLRISFGRSEG
jgi:hypothetical protein